LCVSGWIGVLHSTEGQEDTGAAWGKSWTWQELYCGWGIGAIDTKMK
jgi:hypothetical protein